MLTQEDLNAVTIVVRTCMQVELKPVVERLEKVEEHLQVVDVRLSSLEERMDNLEESVEEIRTSANRLVDWADKVEHVVEIAL